MIEYSNRIPDCAGVIAQNSFQLAQCLVCPLIVLKGVRQHELRDKEEHFEQALTHVPAEITRFDEAVPSQRGYVLRVALQSSGPLEDHAWCIIERFHFDSPEKGDAFVAGRLHGVQIAMAEDRQIDSVKKRVSSLGKHTGLLYELNCLPNIGKGINERFSPNADGPGKVHQNFCPETRIGEKLVQTEGQQAELIR